MRLHLDVSKFNSILFTLIFIFSMTESTVFSYYFTLSNPISVILLTLLIGFNFKKIKYDYHSLIFIIRPGEIKKILNEKKSVLDCLLLLF